MQGSFDFETYSEAGHLWDAATNKWVALKGASQGKKGLGVVGAAVYSEHPSAEVLTFSYRLPGETQKYRWTPTDPPPQRLFDCLARGGVFKAQNVMFERLIWQNVCVPKYGWPPLPEYQLRCTMATARVNSLPGALANLSDVLALPTPKDADGTRLLTKFSVPRNPTLKDPRRRITPACDPADFERLQAYCDTDLDAEQGAADRMTPMSADELTFWWVDQEINWRGLGVDRPAIRDCIAVLEEALTRYGEEFRALTGGLDPTQLQAARGWLAAQGVAMTAMDEEAIDAALKRTNLPPSARRALEIRQLIGSASVKKLYAMDLQASRDDRLRNLIVHHGARTGRPTGEGPQPLNLPKAGPDLRWCECGKPFAAVRKECPWCGQSDQTARKAKWSAEAVEPALEIMATRSLDLVEYYFGDALLCISGCVRGLFVAAPGHDLIASDYSAIEAVVIAMLAGEQWRIDAFRENKPIYLLSASKITGTPVEDYEAYHARNGDHHPDRQKIGKVAELACGFGGWVGSYKAFGSQETDDTIKAQILAWRAASPAIVQFWGGQTRNWKTEYFGVEGMAIQAVQHPGVVFEFRGLRFQVRDTPAGTPALYIRLLSGRELTYHRPMLSPATRPGARQGERALTYWTWNSNPKYGAMGWVPMPTYGGRLTENIVQATAHDILRHAILQLRAAGYPTVLHVYDEIVVEVPHGRGSIEEVERIMGQMPSWAHDWPIRAAGGWRGRRYRK